MSAATDVKQFSREKVDALNTRVYTASAIACSRDGVEVVVIGPTPDAVYAHACEYFGPHIRTDLTQQVVVMDPTAYRMLIAKAGYTSLPIVKAEPPPPRMKPASKPSRRRRQIFAESEGRCHYCETALTLDGPWHIEHKMPRALGGGDEPTNLVASCIPCNKAKLDTTDIEFKAKLAATKETA